MNKFLKTLLLGIVVWIIPFLASLFVWNTETGGPSIDIAWFYALMSFSGVIGLFIAAYYQFKGIKRNSVREGWITGITWYIECLALDFVFLVVLFGMTLSSYAHLLLTYLSTLITTVLIGYIKR